MPIPTLLAPAIERVHLPDDAPSVAAFARALRAEPRFFGPSSTPKPRARLVAELARLAGPAAVGAFVGHEIVGLAGLCPRRGQPDEADLYLAVLSLWRRSGIARRLGETLLDGCGEFGYAAVHLSTDRSNRAAIALGQALGMTEIDAGRGRVELRRGGVG